MRIFKKMLFLIISAFVFNACSDKTKEVKEEEKNVIKDTTNKGEETAISDYVELTDNQIKAAGIELGTVEQRGINTSFSANGILEVPNQFKAKVSSIFSGKVTKLYVKPGDRIGKGQAIATIINPDLVSVQQQYLTVSAKINLAQIEYERQKILVAGNAGARKNLQQAESELRTLNIEKTGLQHQLSTLGISSGNINNHSISSVLTVRAPISGIISKVNAEIGSSSDVNTIIAEIVDNKQIQVKLSIYEKDLQKIHKGQLIHFTLTNNPKNEFHAVVKSIGSSFEEGTTTIAVRATIEGNHDGLIEGMSLNAVINMGNVNVPSVPDEAIVNFQGMDYIFIEKEKNAEKQNLDTTKSKEKNMDRGKSELSISFKRVKVAKGLSNLGYSEIRFLENVPDNLKIITKGAFFAMGKMTNSGEEE